MPTQSKKRPIPSDLPNRVVALILGLISIGFIAHMNVHWHETAFRTPLALVIVSTVLTLVGAAVSLNTWRVNAAWCPKRTASMVIMGLAAAACSAACAALTAQVDLERSYKIKLATVGLQTSKAVLDFINAVFSGLQFAGIGRGKQSHAATDKEERNSEETV